MITIINHTAGYPDPSPEDKILDGTSLLDISGYIPKEEQLRALTESGEALEEYRRKMYPDYVASEDTLTPEAIINNYDPTTRKDYEIFDYHADVAVVRSNVLRTERDYRDKKRTEDLEASITKIPEKRPAPEVTEPVADQKS